MKTSFVFVYKNRGKTTKVPYYGLEYDSLKNAKKDLAAARRFSKKKLRIAQTERKLKLIN